MKPVRNASCDAGFRNGRRCGSHYKGSVTAWPFTVVSIGSSLRAVSRFFFPLRPATDLPDKLEGRVEELGVGNRRVEVEEHFDVSAPFAETSMCGLRCPVSSLYSILLFPDSPEPASRGESPA